MSEELGAKLTRARMRKQQQRAEYCLPSRNLCKTPS